MGKLKKIIMGIIILMMLAVTIKFALSESIPISVRPLTAAGAVYSNTAFDYVFNFTTDSACNNVVFNATATITTDTYGIGFEEIDISGMTGNPRYLCEYRGGTLRKVHNISALLSDSARAYGNLSSSYINVSNDIYSDRNIFAKTAIYIAGLAVSTGSHSNLTETDVEGYVNNSEFIFPSGTKINPNAGLKFVTSATGSETGSYLFGNLGYGTHHLILQGYNFTANSAINNKYFLMYPVGGYVAVNKTISLPAPTFDVGGDIRTYTLEVTNGTTLFNLNVTGNLTINGETFLSNINISGISFSEGEIQAQNLSIKKFNEVYHVQQYATSGDGSEGNPYGGWRASIQSILSQDNVSIVFDEGWYICDSAGIYDDSNYCMLVSNNSAIIGKGEVWITQSPTGVNISGFIMDKGAITHQSYDVTYNVIIDNLNFYGNTGGIDYGTNTTSSYGTAQAIWFTAAKNYRISNIYQKDFGEYAVVLFSGRDSIIENIRCEDSVWNETDQVYVGDCVFLTGAQPYARNNIVNNLVGRNIYNVFMSDDNLYSTTLGHVSGQNISNSVVSLSGAYGMVIGTIVGESISRALTIAQSSHDILVGSIMVNKSKTSQGTIWIGTDQNPDISIGSIYIEDAQSGIWLRNHSNYYIGNAVFKNIKTGSGKAIEIGKNAGNITISNAVFMDVTTKINKDGHNKDLSIYENGKLIDGNINASYDVQVYGNIIFSNLLNCDKIDTSANGTLRCRSIGNVELLWTNNTYGLFINESYPNVINVSKLNVTSLYSGNVNVSGNLTVDGEIFLSGKGKINLTEYLDSSLLGYWTFNGNANDSSQYGFNETKIGVNFTNDVAYFDGVNDIITVFGTFVMGNTHTFTFWIKPSATTLGGIIGVGAQAYHPLIYYNNGGLTVYSPSSAPNSVTVNNIANLNEWTFIAITYNGSNMSIYKNGNLNTHVAYIPETGTQTNLYFNSNAGSATYNGFIDESRFYNRELTSGEIKQIYNNNYKNFGYFNNIEVAENINITKNLTAFTARITNLISCDTIDTSANGTLQCGTDAGGGAGNVELLWTNNTYGLFINESYPNVINVSKLNVTELIVNESSLWVKNRIEINRLDVNITSSNLTMHNEMHTCYGDECQGYIYWNSTKARLVIKVS